MPASQGGGERFKLQLAVLDQGSQNGPLTSGCGSQICEDPLGRKRWQRDLECLERLSGHAELQRTGGSLLELALHWALSNDPSEEFRHQ